MIICNQKPIRLIGFYKAAITRQLERSFNADAMNKPEISIIEPMPFLDLKDSSQYQYVVAFTLDNILRATVIDKLNSESLDRVTFIHDTATVENINSVGKGSVIAPYTFVASNAMIGKDVLIDPYCSIAHDVELGNNCLLRVSVHISGHCKIGNDVVFNLRASVLDKIHICSDVELLAHSNVTKSISKPGRYAGSLARRIGDRIDF